MIQSLITNIREKYPAMSPSHKRIAEYLLQHYDKAVFFTAKELGQILHTSESTVIRFANLLNYKGYPELQKTMQNMIKNKLTTVDRLQFSLQNKQENVLHKILNTDMNNVKLTLQETESVNFEKAVTAIAQARNIYIISLRSTLSLGYFLSFYLQLLLKNCHLIHAMGSFFEELSPAGPEDLVIGISFPRYTKQTVDGLKYTKENGAQILAITDSITSPLAQYSDYMLLAHSEQLSFIDSLTAPLSLINALIIAVGAKDSNKTTAALNKLEDAWQAYHVYYRE